MKYITRLNKEKNYHMSRWSNW